MIDTYRILSNYSATLIKRHLDINGNRAFVQSIYGAADIEAYSNLSAKPCLNFGAVIRNYTVPVGQPHAWYASSSPVVFWVSDIMYIANQHSS